jgi:APA family basic amino acid/polyamine antiporter
MHTHELRRVLGLWSVVAFGVTNEIAAGLFFVSTQIQQTAPGVGDLVPWLMIVGGLLTFATVVAYRYFFASGLVGAGGEYVIISRAVSPFFGFLATFLSWFGVSGSLGTLAYTAPKFLANSFDAIGATGMAQFLGSTAGTVAAGLILLWGVWFIHVRGVRLAGTLAVAAMCFVVVVALVVIGYGFTTGPDVFAAAMQQRLHVSVAHVLASAPVTRVNPAVAFGTALPVLFFGYLGLSTATQTGGEAVDARRALSKGVVIAVCLVTAIYTLFAFAVYHAVPWQLIAGLSALKFNDYTTSTGLLGLVMPAWLASLMNVFVALIVIKTFLPLYLAQSRWIYAWAKDGLLPDRFAATHARFRTPVLALTIAAALGSLTLAESIPLGYVFGVQVRVLACMIVFFFLGLGMLLFPRTAPALYIENQSAIARNRPVQILAGLVIMGFSTWFAISIVVASLDKYWLLQPAVQAVIVALIGVLIYSARSGSLRRAATAATPEQ